MRAMEIPFLARARNATVGDVLRLYRDLLHREPESAQVVAEKQGWPIIDVAIAFAQSPEFLARARSATAEDVSRLEGVTNAGCLSKDLSRGKAKGVRRLSFVRKSIRVARGYSERERPVILMYHRVARLAHDPWQLAVSPERFVQQIEALVQLRRVVPLQWLAAKLSRGRLPRKVAAVTFDDGYSDVLADAKPVLDHFTCPATVFLASGAIGSRAFWWDELSRMVFEPRVLPPELVMEIAGRVHRWRCDSRPTGSVETAVFDDSPTASREEFLAAIWRLLRLLDPELRWELLTRLGTWAGIETESTCASRPLTEREVRRLSTPGFIDIGAHTVTHPVLPSLDDASRRFEINDSRRACEELIGGQIHTFAYPFGDFDEATVDYVRSAGFACACTTKPERLSIRSDLMLLPRLGIYDWEGSEFARRLDCSEGM